MGSKETLAPGRYHAVSRMLRASSAEPDAVSNTNTIDPSHSLNESGSPKVSLSSRFMKRQPTVDTYSFTKEEFEVK